MVNKQVGVIGVGIPLEGIKSMCRDIIKTYTFHVRDKVKEGREEYIETGIDEDIEQYKKVFLDVLTYVLGVDEKRPNIVILESKEVLKPILSNKDYASILTTHRLMVYTTCEVMFEKVMEELGYNEDK